VNERDDGFEVSFVVALPRDDAWERLVSAAPHPRAITKAEDGQWWMPGFEDAVDPVDVEPGRRLRGRKANFPCEGTEIVVVFEDAETGTRITIVQTGFGDDFSEQKAWLSTGWGPIAADLVVFFETGVSLGRHLQWWSGIGCEVAETPAGLVVGNVHATGLAADVGMRPGDLIVDVCGAPVTTISGLSILMRGPLRRDEPATISYLRCGQVITATGTV